MSDAAATRTERTVQLLLWLMERGAVTKAEVARRFVVTDRTAAEDLQLLARVTGDIHPSGRGRLTRWIVDPAAHVRRLGILDRVSLLLGRDLASFLEGTALHEGLERVGADARDVGRARHDPHLHRKFRALHEPARSYADQREVLDDLLDGLLRQRQLDLCYGADADNCTWQADVQPLTLVVYRRGLYLLGLPADRSHVHRWSVSKVQQVRVGAPFEYPRKWDPDAHLRGWFGIWADGPVEPVIIEFAPEVAHYVRIRRWGLDQVLVPRADGGVRLEMRSGGRELVRWVLEWGDKARVVEPGWLREAVVDELSNALSQYERGAP